MMVLVAVDTVMVILWTITIPTLLPSFLPNCCYNCKVKHTSTTTTLHYIQSWGQRIPAAWLLMPDVAVSSEAVMPTYQ